MIGTQWKLLSMYGKDIDPYVHHKTALEGGRTKITTKGVPVKGFA